MAQGMIGMRIGLSTSSVYPESTAVAFELAGALGFDGVEIMVGTDATSQDVNAIRALRDHYQVPVLSIHAPCLLITQRVWGTDSWGKLVKADEAARNLDADTVVVHPPFRWQRDYVRDFEEGIARMSADTDVRFAVENMYPWRAKVGSIGAYAPDWDVRTGSYSHTTLDVSHCAVSHTDPIEMAADLGSRLHHIHLADGTGSSVDEHLVPGRGNQPVAELLTYLMATQFSGSVIAEISTRRAVDREQREADLAQTLAFFQLHTGAMP
jgi:sugar phosphate isomerase/epimerase